MKKTKKIGEGTYKSFNGLDLSKIPGSAAEILTTNFERFNDCKTYEDVVQLCHELLDGKLDTAWSNKFFYQLGKIGEVNANPRRAFEQAMLYVNNARMKGMGLGMSRGSGRFYEDEKTEEKNESAKPKYTAKQITEAIAYWEKQLKKMDESSVNDGMRVDVKFSNARPDIIAFWSFDEYEFGIKKSDDFLNIIREWKLKIEAFYNDNGFAVEVVSIEGPVHYDNEFNVGLKCLAGCDRQALQAFNDDNM